MVSWPSRQLALGASAETSDVSLVLRTTCQDAECGKAHRSSLAICPQLGPGQTSQRAGVCQQIRWSLGEVPEGFGLLREVESGGTEVGSKLAWLLVQRLTAAPGPGLA